MSNFNLEKDVQAYWGMRAKGYSLSTKEELANADNIHRRILKSWLTGNNTAKTALDIGCGPGFLAIELAKLGFKVTAMDSCEQMLAEAKENASNFPIDFLLSDATAASFEPMQFDVIASRNVVWNLPNPSNAYRQWFKWLKPHGKLIIFDGNHYRYLTDSARHDRPHQETHRHLGNVDISIMEKIAKNLPMTELDRPQYDESLLKSIGFVNIKTVVLSRTDNQIHDFALIGEKNHAD